MGLSGFEEVEGVERVEEEEEDIFVIRHIYSMIDMYQSLGSCLSTRYSRHSSAEYIHRLHAL